jgi:phenylacetate-coenzyme A ligase PaaK-like adenylate-forming protein
MGRLAKIRGRCDEMVVCGMGNVGPWVFDEVLRGVTGIGGDWQVVIGHEGARDAVVVHVEMEDSSSAPAAETMILSNLRERFGDFWRNREMRLYELRVAVHPNGSLRGQGRKLRRVVDERQMRRHPSVLPV